jgi:hypothetical protein
MNTQNATTSLIDISDLTPIEEAKKEAPAEVEKATPRKRTRAKPYEQIKTQVQIAHERKLARKEAKANGKGVVKPIAGKKRVTGKASPVKAVKASPKKGKKGELPTATGTGVSKGGEKCSMCGKRLTRGTSIQDGMGPDCARQIKRLPAGVTMEQHYEDLIVMELPKGYIKLKEAFKIVHQKGASGYQFMIACGGNRAMRPPLNDNFKMIFFKHTRYVPKASVSDKELARFKK